LPRVQYLGLLVNLDEGPGTACSQKQGRVSNKGEKAQTKRGKNGKEDHSGIIFSSGGEVDQREEE